MSGTRLLVVAALASVGAGFGGGRYLGLRAVRAETQSCTAITTLPYIVTIQGIYCLTGDLSTAMTSGNAITISVNNVVLDLNGHKLGGLSAGTGTTAVGVVAALRQNVTVKNGTIRGFYYGIKIEDSSPYTTSQGHVIEDVRVDQNTYVGIFVAGRGNLVHRCQVVATGGSTNPGTGGSAYGLWLFGPGNRVIDTDIATVTEQGGSAIGILFGPGSPDVLAVKNRITEAGYGITMADPGKYQNNLTSSVATPFTGGTDAGRNN